MLRFDGEDVNGMIRIAPYGEGLRLWCHMHPWYIDINGWMPMGLPLVYAINAAMVHVHDEHRAVAVAVIEADE